MGKVAGLIFNEIKVEGYESVIEVIDEPTGLHAIIALHNTSLGPTLGGIRAYPYPSFKEALQDALRLAKAMTYKAAIAETGTGGGKSVIISDPKKPKSKELLLAFAEAVNTLEGTYICAEDVGVRMDDLAVIRQGTHFAVGLPHPKSSGDPSPFTAYGGFLGLKALARQLWGVDSLKGRTVAIQGLGAVGRRLAEYLFWEGAQLVVTDLKEDIVQQIVRDYGAIAVKPSEIYRFPCDIFAPCALGGILNHETIPLLLCKGIAGLANNQLHTEADGQALMNRGILYSPDYVVNSGGLLNVCMEIEKVGYNPLIARQRLERIYDRLLRIYDLSEKKGLPTNLIANELAHYNLQKGVGKRKEPVIFHH